MTKHLCTISNCATYQEILQKIDDALIQHLGLSDNSYERWLQIMLDDQSYTHQYHKIDWVEDLMSLRISDPVHY